MTVPRHAMLTTGHLNNLDTGRHDAAVFKDASGYGRVIND